MKTIFLLLFSLPIAILANTLNVTSPPSGDITGGTSTGNVINLKTDNINFNGFSVFGNTINGSNNATRNTINITARGLTNVGDIYGGRADADSQFHVINISGEISSASGDNVIYGGWGQSPTSNGTSYVNANTINISGNAVIKGFNIYTAFMANDHGGGGGANNNTMNISGNPDLSTSSIFGGYNSKTKVSSGNNLNLSSHISVLTAGYFQNYNFYTDGKNISQSMLKATQTTIDMNSAVIGLYLQANSNPLYDGDKIFLVENMSGSGLTQASRHIRVGATIIYDWEILADGGNLYAVIKNDIIPPDSCFANQDLCQNPDNSLPNVDCNNYQPLCEGGGNGGGAGRLNPETKSLSAGRIASIAMLSSGLDLLVENGISSLNSALQNDDYGWFSSINAGQIKYNSDSQTNTNNSSIDTQNASFVLGLGSKLDNILMGVFLEGGGGNHNTYNEFEDSIVNGNGRNAYAGGGLLFRLSYINKATYTAPRNTSGKLSARQAAKKSAEWSIYFDVSARGGYAITNYEADYSPDAKYNTGSMYYGGHAGAGLVHGLGVDGLSLNEYVKYLAIVAQGGNVVLDSQEEIQFANIMSSRGVAGIRAKYEIVYIGYAYEQELAGYANAKTRNMAIDAPSIQGGTGVIEAGYDQTFSQKPSRFGAGYGFNIGLGGKYYMGVRNGYSANVKIAYLF
ncbi:MAG: hypothetical protein FWE18_06170 [Alphaproteobacteria bacterium]|nr:hypothetical protein [Alphaproteobacteria bacterium]